MCRKAIRHLAYGDATFDQFPLVVQELVTVSSVNASDLTADGEISADGRVSVRGLGRMLTHGSHYYGCVLSHDDVDPRLRSMIADFTLATGDVLAGYGYRGWFDIDFVQALDGRLYALEVNARRTGPLIAYTVDTRLRELGCEVEAVATAEVIRLPWRVSPSLAFEAFHATQQGMRRRILPTAFMATDALRPSIGIAVTGSTADDAAVGLREARDEFLRQVIARNPPR
jgi:hypothetical protein